MVEIGDRVWWKGETFTVMAMDGDRCEILETKIRFNNVAKEFRHSSWSNIPESELVIIDDFPTLYMQGDNLYVKDKEGQEHRIFAEELLNQLSPQETVKLMFLLAKVHMHTTLDTEQSLTTERLEIGELLNKFSFSCYSFEAK